MKVFGQIAGTLLLTVFSANCIAESLFVTDELQLSVFQKANSKGKLLGRLTSGMSVEILEKKGLFAKVKMPSGNTGWTKVRFLVKEKPVTTLYAELQKEHSSLTATMEQAETKLQALQERINTTSKSMKSELQQLRQQLEDAETANRSFVGIEQENLQIKAQLNAQKDSIPLSWALAGTGASLLLGLLLGLALFDLRSRRRHGGFRIH